MKAKLYIGKSETGEKGWARLRAKEVGMENTVIIDAREFSRNNPFVFHRINENTKLVIINDCPIDFNYQCLFSNITPDTFTFYVNRRGENPKEITVPEVILTAESFDAEKNIGASFEYRFDVRRYDLENGTEISYHEMILEMEGYIEFLRNESIDKEFDSRRKIEFLLEFLNENTDLLHWIKDVFGNCVNEDFGNMSLSDFIDAHFSDKLKDFERMNNKMNFIDDVDHSIDFNRLFEKLKGEERPTSENQSSIN